MLKISKLLKSDKENMLLSWTRCLIVIVFRKSYPMILVANKVDLVHLRKVSEEEGRELAAELQIPYIETSAKVPPINVDIAFHELVRAIRQQAQHVTPNKKKKKRRYGDRCDLM